MKSITGINRIPLNLIFSAVNWDVKDSPFSYFLDREWNATLSVPNCWAINIPFHSLGDVLVAMNSVFIAARRPLPPRRVVSWVAHPWTEPKRPLEEGKHNLTLIWHFYYFFSASRQLFHWHRIADETSFVVILISSRPISSTSISWLL